MLLTSFSSTGADSENISLQANLHVKICFHGTLTWNTIFIFSEVLPKDDAVTPFTQRPCVTASKLDLLFL